MHRLVFSESFPPKRCQWPRLRAVHPENITENWAAYIGRSNWGLGVYVPGIDRLTYYRIHGSHAGSSGDACSYLAPIKTMAITSGTVVDYDVYMTLGTPEQIRATFAAIHGSNEGT